MGSGPDSQPRSARIKPARRRRFWRGLLLSLSILLVGIILFQKAILLAAIRWELARYAKGQNWTLQCDISGDPIRNLEISNLNLQMPDPDSLQSLQIGHLKASYDILDLVFSGWSQVLDDVEIEDTHLVLRETSVSPDTDDSMAIPFPRSLRLKNFNFQQGPLRVQGMETELVPEKPGTFRVAELSWPGWGDWKALGATTQYDRGIINLEGLDLRPLLIADSLRVDGADLFKNKLQVAFKGLLFGGQTELQAEWRQERDHDVLNVKAEAKGVSLDQASDFLQTGQDFGGRAESVGLQFSGTWQDRSTWDGTLSASLVKGTVHGSSAWESLNLSAKIEKGEVTLDQFAFLMDAKNQLTGKGKAQLMAPFRYSGQMQGKLDDLSALQGLLSLDGNSRNIAGQLAVDWTGEGEGGFQSEAKHQGKGFLVLHGGTFADTSGIEVEVRGDYTPQSAVFQMVQASAAGWKLSGTGSWQDRRVKFPDIAIYRGPKQLLKGSVDVPFYPGDWRNPGNWLSPEDPVAVNFQGKGIQLEPLMRELGSPNPWKGEVNLDLVASGTLKTLVVKGTLEGKNLISGLHPDFLPAQLKADLQIQDNQFNISATLTQPSLQPVKFWGNMPFHAEDYLGGSKNWQESPLRAELAIASFDLGRVKKFFPEILEIQGKAGVDVHLAGTFADPLLWGEVSIDLPKLRFSRRAIPNFTSVVARLKFDKDRMQIETARGNLAGGPFQVTGTMDFSKLTDPMMDIHLNGTDLLLYRDDQVTSRANMVLGIKGPFNSAKVEGTVALTKSQFFRNIDILPISLPGQSAPELQGSVLPEFSVKIPPISAWTFDIKISNKDPFLIKGNLANGRIVTNLHLTGTGLAPKLDGDVSVTNLEATLPFSTMLLDRGYLYFKPDQGLNATLDFRGTSKIQDYLVTVYVYGTVQRPQTLFVSQPPLSEQDIISLIATGATTTELGSNSGVIAGKATSLLFQKISRKLFPNAKVSKNELLSRVSFNVESVDAETATPSLGASLKITDEIYLIFDTGADGGFRGRLKYLIRFR